MSIRKKPKQVDLNQFLSIEDVKKKYPSVEHRAVRDDYL